MKSQTAPRREGFIRRFRRWTQIGKIGVSRGDFSKNLVLSASRVLLDSSRICVHLRNPGIFLSGIRETRPGRRQPSPVAQGLRLAGLLAVWFALPIQAQRALQPIPILTPRRQAPVDFESEILPILKHDCLACHNQTKPKGGLILETPAAILKGGENGPAVSVKKPGDSLLLRAAAHQDPDLEMPPPENKVSAVPLTPEELGLVQTWIEEGAKGEVRGLGPVAWRPMPAGITTIFALALTQDGEFAACGRGNRVFVYQIPARKLAAELIDPQLTNSGPAGAAHHDTVNSMAFTRDGEWLASGGYREVKLWRRQKPSRVFQSDPPAEPANCAGGGDGHWVAAGTQDGGLILWPAEGGPARLLKQLPPSLAPMAFSPNSSLLAVGGPGGIQVLGIPDGKVAATMESLTNLTALTWTGATNLAVADASGEIRLLSLNQGLGALALEKTWKAQGSVIALEASPDAENRLLSACADGSVTVWDVKRAKAKFETKLESAPQAVALRPDGERVATVSGASVKLWKVSNSKLIAEIKGDRALTDAAAAARRETALAQEELDFRKAALHAFETNRAEIVTRQKQAGDTNAAAAKLVLEKQTALTNAIQSRLAAAKALGELGSKVRSAVEAYLEAEITGTKETTNLLAQAKTALDGFSGETKDKLKPERKKLAEASQAVTDAQKALQTAEAGKTTAGEEVERAAEALRKADEAAAEAKQQLENAETAKKRAAELLDTVSKTASEAEKPVRSLRFSPDNSLLLTAGVDGFLRTWGAESGTPGETIGNAGHPLGIVFRNPDTALVCASSGLSGWNLASRWRLERAVGDGGEASPLADRVNALVFTTDGRQLITGGGEPSRDGEIKIWETATGRLLKEFKHVHSDTVFALDLSRDDRLLASAGADRFARVTEMATGKTLKNLEGHVNHVLGVGWRRNGRSLMTAGADNLAKIWDYQTAERLKNVESFGKEVTSVSFISPGGQALLTCGDGQAVIVNEQGEKKKTLQSGGEYLYAGAVSADGLTVVAGGADGILRVWEGADGKLAKEFRPTTH